MGISDRARGYILGNDILMGVGFLVVAARFYCRIKTGTKRGLWWDDLFILLAYVGFIPPWPMAETCPHLLTKFPENSSSRLVLVHAST